MATTTSRPPSAARLPRTRESRPLILGLAVLLIVGGALGSAYLAIQSGHRAYFVSVSREVAQGSSITRQDLTRVSLPEDYGDGIASSDVASVVGKTATTRLLPGTVVIPGMLSTKAGLKAGQIKQAFAVDSSTVPADMQPGAQLALSVDTDSETSGTAVLADLLAISRSDGGGGLTAGTSDTVTLTVAFDSSCLSRVTKAIQKKSVIPSQLSGSGTSVSKTCQG